LDFAALLDKPSFWTIIAVVLVIVWSERKAIVSFLFRRAQLREQQHAAEFDLEQEAKRKLVQNSEYSKSLVERLIEALERQQTVYQEMLNTERIERRGATGVMVEQSITTERVAAHSVEMAQEFADIARGAVNRMDAMVQAAQSMERLVESQGHLIELVGWLLVQLSLAGAQDGVTLEQVVAIIRQKDLKRSGEV
jgi:hypothetical protein